MSTVTNIKCPHRSCGNNLDDICFQKFLDNDQYKQWVRSTPKKKRKFINLSIQSAARYERAQRHATVIKTQISIYNLCLNFICRRY